MQDKDNSPYTYEPAFGDAVLSQPPNQVENDVMVEKTLTFFGLNEATAKTLKKMATDQGLDGEPQEIFLIREKGQDELLRKYAKALQFAVDAVMRNPSFPKKKVRTDYPSGYSISEQLPINIMTGITANEIVGDTEVKFKESMLTFLCRPDVSTLDYNKARKMIIETANELLSTFNVEEIPVTSPNHNQKK